MSFPSMNAQVVAGINNVVAGEEWQLFSVPAAVDVSGMEFSFGIPQGDALSSASYTTIVFEDGGQSGTASSVLHTAIDNTTGSGTAWTANTPRDFTGTSTTDLDADDWVTLNIAGGLSTAATGFIYQIAYVYGKPGAIA